MAEVEASRGATGRNVEETVYMLSDCQGTFQYGPFVGKPDLDVAAFAAEFRSQKYAQAEAGREDYVWISDEDFVQWLVDRGEIRRV